MPSGRIFVNIATKVARDEAIQLIEDKCKEFKIDILDYRMFSDMSLVRHPEAAGLRHLAFEVEEIEAVVAEIRSRGVKIGPIRIDENTGRKFTFL